MYKYKRIITVAFLVGMLLNIAVNTVSSSDKTLGEGIQNLWPFGSEKFNVLDGISVQASVSDGYTINAKLPAIRAEAEGGQRINAAIASDFVYVYAAKNGEVSGRAAIAQAFSGWVDPEIAISYEKKGLGATKTVIVTTEVQSATAMKKVKIENRYIYNLRTNELKTEQISVL